MSSEDDLSSDYSSEEEEEEFKRPKKSKLLDKRGVKEVSFTYKIFDNDDWWAATFKEKMSVGTKEFKEEFTKYLNQKLSLNSAAIDLLHLQLEKKLDSNKKGEIHMIFFKDHFKKNGNEVSIEEYYSKMQPRFYDLTDERYNTESLDELKLACMVKEFDYDLFEQFIKDKNLDVANLVNSISSDGGNALHYACKYSCKDEIIRFLIKNKADTNLRDKELFLPIHWALYNNLVDVVDELLDCTNTDGAYLYHAAVDYQCLPHIFKSLKRKGIDINQKLGEKKS